MAIIVIVDDDPTIQLIAGELLKAEGHAIVHAGDGVEALKILEAAPADLVVLDMLMPNMDGLSFLKHLKTTGGYKFTPVIMLTTESQEAKKAEGRAAGARAWITKPFQPSQLVDAVNRLCV